MAATHDDQADRDARRRSAVRLALVLAVVAVGIYAWFIVSNL